MPYVSLYRKYRPQRFADVVGQEHVVQTLQNALKAGRIANGYLFCGTRGVAKTTLARVFAKALNCVGPNGDGVTPVIEPCNQCGPCRSIAAGQCVDVIELDAASNRSVNDMARIRENVQFGPMENRFKTYIVDEAHQLSTDAKDAFLKTLEEPPAGVVFILATTESHAIPITIASRCQQFDFKRGSIGTISSQIERVVGYENVTMSGDAVAAVARAAEGSYRDALSLLEQVLAYKRTDVNVRDVAEVLGAVDAEIITSVVDMIARSDAAQAFGLAEQIFTDGRDTRQFIKSLASRFRDMLYVAVGAKVAGESGVLADAAQLTAQAKKFSPAKLLASMEILAEAERETKFVTHHRLLLEMTLLRLIELPGAVAGETPPPPSVSPVPAPQPTRPAPVTSAQQAPPPAPTPTPPTPARPVSAPPVAATPTAPRPSAPQPGSEQLEYLRNHWQSVLNHVQAKSRGGVKVFSDAFPQRQEGATFVLGFQTRVYFDMFDTPARRQFIEEIICKILHVEPGTYRVRGEFKPGGSEPAAEPSATYTPPPAPQSTKPNESPLLDEVISIFGGNIVDDPA